jgi:hypothetical protein
VCLIKTGADRILIDRLRWRSRRNWASCDEALSPDLAEQSQSRCTLTSLTVMRFAHRQLDPKERHVTESSPWLVSPPLIPKRFCAASRPAGPSPSPSSLPCVPSLPCPPGAHPSRFRDCDDRALDGADLLAPSAALIGPLGTKTLAVSWPCRQIDGGVARRAKPERHTVRSRQTAPLLGRAAPAIGPVALSAHLQSHAILIRRRSGLAKRPAQTGASTRHVCAARHDDAAFVSLASLHTLSPPTSPCTRHGDAAFVSLVWLHTPFPPSPPLPIQRLRRPCMWLRLVDGHAAVRRPITVSTGRHVSTRRLKEEAALTVTGWASWTR